MRRPRGGKHPVSTSLTDRDVERLFYIADRNKVSAATWMRNVIVAALNEVVDPDIRMECAECSDMPSDHDRNGCKRLGCRCPKYRRP